MSATRRERSEQRVRANGRGTTGKEGMSNTTNTNGKGNGKGNNPVRGHNVELSYDVTVQTTYRIRTTDQPTFTRAKQLIDDLRRAWGDDPTFWPEEYGAIELVSGPRSQWSLNNVEHVRAVEGFEPLVNESEDVSLGEHAGVRGLQADLGTML